MGHRTSGIGQFQPFLCDPYSFQVQYDPSTVGKGGFLVPRRPGSKNWGRVTHCTPSASASALIPIMRPSYVHAIFESTLVGRVLGLRGRLRRSRGEVIGWTKLADYCSLACWAANSLPVAPSSPAIQCKSISGGRRPGLRGLLRVRSMACAKRWFLCGSSVTLVGL